VQGGSLPSELAQHVQGVEGGAEHAVELRGDDAVPGPQGGQQGHALGALGKRPGAGDAALDEHALDGQPVHKRVAVAARKHRRLCSQTERIPAWIS